MVSAGLFFDDFSLKREFLLLKSLSFDEKELVDSGGSQKVPFLPTVLWLGMLASLAVKELMIESIEKLVLQRISNALSLDAWQ